MEQEYVIGIDNRILEDNRAAKKLYENYIHTEIYAEIVDFLNEQFPNWRQNDRLGKCAPDLILFIIDYTNAVGLSFLDKNTLNKMFELIDLQYDMFCSTNNLSHDQEIKQEIKRHFNNQEIIKIPTVQFSDFIKSFLSQFNNFIYWSY
jgi:hypothetical protein